MGIFTIHDNPDIDRKIQSELDIITDEILTNIRPITILLAGSFGRGEGSVLIQDTHIIPVMDYDLLIIAGESSLLTDEEVEEVKRKIIGRCRSGELERHVITDCHIDLFQSTPEQFRTNAHLSIHDMKSGSIVIYGNDIRDSIDIDIARLAPSACYFSLFRSIQSLLDMFSTDYLLFPPSERNHFSMVFFCGKIYLHMGTQLSLCHNLYETSCRKRVERITEEYSHSFIDLAMISPDLPDKIKFFSELTLTPDAILKESVDPVELWFETRHDFEIVMKYCLDKIGNIRSDDWGVLSGQLYQSLRRKYYAYFIEHWLERKYHVRSKLIASLMNQVYQLRKEPQFMKGRDTSIKTIKWRTASPLLKLFALSPLLLFSLGDNGSIDSMLYSQFQRGFSETVGGIDSIPHSANITDWESSKEIFKKLLK